MKGTIRWMLAAGMTGALAWTLGCGGGGSSGTSGSQITGNLSRSGAVTLARRGSMPTWIAGAAAWVGARPAVADGTTACGNPAVPAAGIPVTLLLNGAVVQTTSTNVDGEFMFSGLVPGDYVIQVTLPRGTISSPVIVQPGQQTTLVGELDVDCHDVDRDGNRSEIALRVRQTTDDGSQMDADETEDGGQFSGDVHQEDSSVRHEGGSGGNRSDEHDSVTGPGGSSNGDESGEDGSTSGDAGSRD
jgi:hypothetical protein